MLIPFTTGSKTEQTARAEKLEELGLAVVVDEASLTAETLADAIFRAGTLKADRRLPFSPDGTETTAEIVAMLLERRA